MRLLWLPHMWARMPTERCTKCNPNSPPNPFNLYMLLFCLALRRQHLLSLVIKKTLPRSSLKPYFNHRCWTNAVCHGDLWVPDGFDGCNSFIVCIYFNSCGFDYLDCLMIREKSKSFFKWDSHNGNEIFYMSFLSHLHTFWEVRKKRESAYPYLQGLLIKKKKVGHAIKIDPAW